jgi:hypothetical protein
MQILKLYDYRIIESSCPELAQAGGLNIALRSLKVSVLRNLHVEEHVRHGKNICARYEISRSSQQRLKSSGMLRCVDW